MCDLGKGAHCRFTGLQVSHEWQRYALMLGWCPLQHILSALFYLRALRICIQHDQNCFTCGKWATEIC